MRKIPRIILVIVFLQGSILNAQEVKSSVFNDRPDISEIIKINPKDIIDTRRAVNEIDKSTYQPLDVLPPAKSDVSEIYLTSNEEIPVVYLVAGNPTSLEITDITGAPWPILEQQTFSPFLEGSRSASKARNSLWLIAHQTVGEAVISIYLEGLDTVISVRCVSDGENYHRKKTLKVMKLGVNAKVSRNTVQEAEEAGLPTDEDILSASYGVRPVGFTQLKTSSDAVIAWKKGEEILIYTSMDQMIPRPTRIKTGTANGWTAFRIPNTSRLRLTNEAGKVIAVTLEDKPFREFRVGEK